MSELFADGLDNYYNKVKNKIKRLQKMLDLYFEIEINMICTYLCDADIISKVNLLQYCT